MPSSEPGRAAAQRSEPGPAGRTRIESMGVYLPEARATLAERIAQTRSGVRFPLAEMTGIERMPVAGEEQYSLDLAERAIEECLSRSEYGTDEIDLLIACNISRLEGPAIFSIEPADASHLAGRFGMQRALAFDLSNACGGIFSGIYFADAFLRSNLARRALIVSGELISHLAETASKEIGDDFMDPRLGCLTVGDSGLALVLDRAANEGVGFLEVDLFTLGAYGKSCVAHATTQPHGGAIMHNHMITPAEARSLPGSLHAFDLLSRHGWIDDPPEHVILHQTSATTLRDVMREANRMFGRQYLDEHNTHIDLAERGNTATNSHFVTLMDGIREGRAQSGDRVAFGVSGSGQVLGSALYQLDDLPDRIRQGRAAARPARGSPQRHPLSGHRSPVAGRVPIRIAACASAPSTGDDRDPDDYTGAARSAARACLQAWARPRSEIDLLLYSGVYRHNFINEPALASLLAGELEINDTLERAGDRRSFCCDLMNGGVGFLQACYVAGATIAAGRARSALVVTSEVENNAEHHPYERLGLAEGGGAVVLERNYGERTGFGQFIFRSYPKHLGALVTRARLQGPHPFVERQRASNLESIYLEVIDAAVQDLLAREALKVSDFDLVLPPLMGSEFSGALARVLGFPQTRIITAAGSGADHLTCSIPVAFESAVKRGIAQGDRALVIAVGSGIDVGVATYHF